MSTQTKPQQGAQATQLSYCWMCQERPGTIVSPSGVGFLCTPCNAQLALDAWADSTGTIRELFRPEIHCPLTEEEKRELDRIYRTQEIEALKEADIDRLAEDYGEARAYGIFPHVNIYE